MRWHKEMLRGFRDNAAYEGGRYLILALLTAAWPIINSFLQRPWYWRLNFVLILVAIILFIIAIIKFSKVARTSSSPEKKNSGLMKPELTDAQVPIIPTIPAHQDFKSAETIPVECAPNVKGSVVRANGF